MSHFDFGKYRINIKKLKQNILSVSTPKNHIMTHLIGSEIQTLLLDYKDYGKFDLNLYHRLNKDQGLIMNDLLQRSGMDDVLHIRISEDEMKSLLDRYELLRGQILGGQDAVEVRKELKHIVLKLVQLRKLPLRMAHDLLLDLALLE